MNKLSIVLLISLTIGYSLNGQDNHITEFDLYGCWILERNNGKQQTQRLIYVRCEDSDSKLEIPSSKFSLFAFNKSEVQTTSPTICFGTTAEKGTWTFNEDDRVVKIFHNQEWLEDFKKQEPVEYTKFNRPKKFVWLKFRIVELSKNQLEVKKLSTTTAIIHR